MSSYFAETRHPTTKKYEKAIWIDNYFGNHIYGVRFEKSGDIFNEDIFDMPIKGRAKNKWEKEKGVNKR